MAANIEIVQNADASWSAYCEQCDGYVRTTRAPHAQAWDLKQLASRQAVRHNELHEHLDEALRELMNDAMPMLVTR